MHTCLEWLSEQCLVPSSLSPGEVRVLVDAGTGAAVDKGFAVVGRTIRVHVANEGDRDRPRLQVRSIARGHHRNVAETASLVTGNIRFLDMSRTGQLRIEAVAQLASLVDSHSSFLALWDRANELEWQLILRRARDVGSVAYGAVQGSGDGMVFTVEQNGSPDADGHALSRVREKASLEASEQRPAWLDGDLCFDEFLDAAKA